MHSSIIGLFSLFLSPNIQNQADFSFYGNKISIPYDSKFFYCYPANSYSFDAVTARESADKLKLCNYSITVNALQHYKDSLKLDDWGYVKLMDAFIVKGMKPYNHNHSNLLKWFLLSESGINAALLKGQTGFGLFAETDSLLHFAENILLINEVPHMNLDPGFDFSRNGSFQTCLRSGKKTDRKFSYGLAAPIQGPRTIEKIIHFPYKGVEYSVNLSLDTTLIRYYKDFPDVYPSSFYSTYKFSPSLNRSLHAFWDTVLVHRTWEESLEMILSFSSHCASHKPDREAWNKEEVFIPEEFFYYTVGDCEDFAFVFSILARDILDTTCIFIHYPADGKGNQAHVNVGLQLKSNPEQDHVTFEGKEYTIVEPSSKNSPIGKSFNDIGSFFRIDKLRVE